MRTVYRRRRMVVAAGLALALFGTIQAVGNLFGSEADPAGARRGSRPDATPAAASAGDRATVPVGPHKLRVVTHPAGAAITVESSGRTLSGRTPFAGRVRGGDVTLTLTLDGHNPLSHRMVLDRRRSLSLWLDPEGSLHHKLGEFRTGSLPKQVAFSPDGSQIWVTPLGESGIEIYHARTFRRMAEIPTGDYGTVEVIFTANGATAYVTQMQTASVLEIDTATFEVRRRIETGGVWSKIMALSPDERTLYVANWSGNTVSAIKLGSGRASQLPSAATPRGLYVTPDGKRLYVAGFEDGELQRIDIASGRSKTLITTGGAMRHFVGDPKTGRLYADDMGTDEVFVVDLATEKVEKLADTDHTPNTIDLSADGKVLYVSNRGENNPTSYGLPGPEWGTVLAIDTATGELLDAIVAGNQTTGLDVSPDGRLLAFSDFLDNRVSVYAIPTYETLAAGDGGRAQERLADLEKP